MRLEARCVGYPEAKRATFAAVNVKTSVKNRIVRKLAARGVWPFLVWGASGCFSPDSSGATCLACPDNVCPSGFVCQNQRCVDPQSPDMCSNGGQHPAASGGNAGEAPETGGTGNVVNASGGTGDVVNASGGAGDDANEGGAFTGGTGGSAAGGSSGNGGVAGSSGSDGITIELETPALCTERDVSLSIAVEGGKEPYHLSVDGAPPGLRLDLDSTPPSIDGTPTTPGDFQLVVRVEDANQAVATRRATLHVDETPVLTTTSLPDACPGEVYGVDLTASGAGSNDYGFEVDGLGGTGLTADTAGHITGRLPNFEGNGGTVDVDVVVTHGECSSDRATLHLTEDSSKNAACPAVEIAENELTLPSPCAGDDYAALLNVTGGTAPYQWRLAAAPDGLELDPESQTDAPALSGRPTAGGLVTVEVTDAADRVVQRDFTLDTARVACWLAYLSASTGADELNLFDPLLGNRHSFPTTGTDPVLDFKFAPDGRLLAYRTGAEPDARLTLLELSTRREQSLDFEHVTHYSWSDDSSALAVAFDGGQGPVLGGVDTAGDGGAGTTLAFPELDAVAAEVDADPVWYAGTNLGYLTANDDGSDTLLLAMTARTATGFAAPDVRLYDDSFNTSAYLRAAPAGVFVLTPSGYSIDYFDADVSQFLVEHDEDLVAPNGRFTARADSDALDVFEPTTLSGPVGIVDVYPDGTANTCTALLGWSSDGGSVVCTAPNAGEPTQADFWVFRVDPNGKVSSPPVGITEGKSNGYSYPASGETGFARLLSPSGNRFAFATSDSVYSAPTIGGTAIDFAFTFTTPTGGSDAVLAFSPDERFLLEHRGTFLGVVDLTTSANDPPLLLGNGEVPPPAPACSEDFQAAPGAFCGESRTHAAFAWSSDSRLLAFATSTGSLVVKDLRLFDQSTIQSIEATDDCGASCRAGDRFAFQP